MKNRILLVDGMALLFRGYYATAYSGNFMKNKAGIATNGVHQFLRYFIDGINKFKPSHILCCWDMGSQTFRNEIFEDYKANRSDPPEELIPQFNLVKEVVALFNIPNIGLNHYEADDIIGTIAKQCHQNNEVIILTGDLDMLQLVDSNINVAIMKRGIGNYDIYNQNNFHDKRGLHPYQLIDFKGLTGDSADNYPGIKGVGEKTALKLLQTYGSVDNVINNIDKLTPSQQRNFNDYIDVFYICRQLATIKCDLTLDIDLNKAYFHINKTQVDNKINDLGVRFQSVEKYLKHTN